MCVGSRPRSTVLSGNRSTHLATGRHLHPWIKGMRTAVQKVSKFVFQSPTQVRTKRNPTSHLSVQGFCVLDHSTPRSFVLLLRSRIQQRTSPCMEHVKLDHPISINAHIVVNAPEPATTLQHLNNLEACSSYQTPDATRCVQVHFDAAFSPLALKMTSCRGQQKR